MMRSSFSLYPPNPGEGIQVAAPEACNRSHLGFTPHQSSIVLRLSGESLTRQEAQTGSRDIMPFAPERVAGPTPRPEWTPRDIAARLIGGSVNGPARLRNLELVRLPAGGFRLTDLLTGEVVEVATVTEVAKAIEAVRS